MLELSGALLDGGFNLDLQYARRWECLAALGRDDEAEEAWSMVLALTGRDERAPRQHSGLHTDYPSFEVWRAFGELRVAQAHRWSAAGMHPSEELRERRLGPPSVSPEEWNARARGRVAAVVEKLEEWVQLAAAGTMGPILADLADEIAKTTDEDRISDARFVMHKR